MGSREDDIPRVDISARIVIAVIVIVGASAVEIVDDELNGENLEDLVCDYYSYPQLYGQDDQADHMNANDGDKAETTSDDIDEFVITRDNAETNNKRVTYVPNGAVISNVQPTQEIPADAITIENTDYEEEEWPEQGTSPQKGNEFDSTLTGMMGALAEIQRKGDNMLAGIRRQREVLDHLERKAERAERRREQAEVLARQMETEKQNLETEVFELKFEKDTMMVEMQEDEVEMTRVRSGLAPLLSQVSERKSELVRFESSIKTKKSELQNFQTQIEEVSKNLVELKNTAVSVSAPSPVTSSPVLLMVLVLSIGFNLLVGAQAARGLLTEQRMDHLVTQFTDMEGFSDPQEMEGFGALAGLAGLFGGDDGVRRRVINEDTGNTAHNTFQPHEELYSYSDLPRLF